MKKRVLAVGAHYDDIELNCAGTLLKFKDDDMDVYLVIVTDGSKGGRKSKRYKEQLNANKIMGYKDVYYLYQKDGKIQHTSLLVKLLQTIITKVNPDIIFTHTEHDFHQDHIVVSRAVRAANRFSTAGLVVFPSQDFRIPFASNLHVDISEQKETKDLALNCFDSQKNKPWFNRGTDVEQFRIEYLAL